MTQAEQEPGRRLPLDEAARAYLARAHRETGYDGTDPQALIDAQADHNQNMVDAIASVPETHLIFEELFHSGVCREMPLTWAQLVNQIFELAHEYVRDGEILAAVGP